MAGKQVTIISNGTQGKPSEYKQLVRMGVGLFELPVHSAQAVVHDRMAQQEGSWQKSVSSVKTILKLGGYVVPVVVITKHNVKVLDETLDFIASIGCKRVMLNRYNIGGKSCANPMDVSATAEELRNAFSLADKKAEKEGFSLSANVCSPVCLLNPADYPHIAFGHCSFDVLQRPITLDIHGNIRLCNHSPVVAGNIFENDLAEILYSDYAGLWEKSVPEFCASCVEWKKCKGGCRAASEQRFGSLMVDVPVIKWMGIGGL
jgi:radical SAM protein with 4Fe4S-binding SPASM domain